MEITSCDSNVYVLYALFLPIKSKRVFDNIFLNSHQNPAKMTASISGMWVKFSKTCFFLSWSNFQKITPENISRESFPLYPSFLYIHRLTFYIYQAYNAFFSAWIINMASWSNWLCVPSICMCNMWKRVTSVALFLLLTLKIYLYKCSFVCQKDINSLDLKNKSSVHLQMSLNDEMTQ